MICENCDSEHDGLYGSGRFCSNRCAKSFSTKSKRKEINKKVSEKLSGEQYYCSKCGNIIKKNNKTGLCFVCLKTDEKFRQRLSESLRGKTGGYRKGGGRTKGEYYKNDYYDSHFEVEVAQFLESNNIEFVRNVKKFEFVWERNTTYYIPDFYLPAYDLYLETKGYWWNKEEKTKFAVGKHKLNWIELLYKEEWLVDKNILIDKIMGL